MTTTKFNQETVDLILKTVKNYSNKLNITFTKEELSKFEMFDLCKINNEEEDDIFYFEIPCINVEPIKLLEIDNIDFKPTGEYVNWFDVEYFTKLGACINNCERYSDFILIDKNTYTRCRNIEEIMKDENYRLQDKYSHYFNYSHYNLVILHEILHSLTCDDDSEDFTRKVILFAIWVERKLKIK